MTKQYRGLVTDLVFQVKTLAKEALRGSEPARQWCVDSFPAHVDFFLALWAGSDDRPPQTPPRRTIHQGGARRNV